MRRGYKKSGTPSQPNPLGLSIVPESGVRSDRDSLSQKVMQCPTCAQQTDAEGDDICEMCGTGLSSGVAEANYSGHEPNLVPNGQEVYHFKPTVRTVNERRHLRIPCRDVKACIKTEQGFSVVVNIVNISRGGVCFTGSTEFSPGTPVSIATHYIKGGHNIYQDGRIVRVHCKGSATLPGVYAVEFLRKPLLTEG